MLPMKKLISLFLALTMLLGVAYAFAEEEDEAEWALQCFCLENPRDGGAWWAAVHGVSQSRTRLNRLSGSSGSREE